MVSVIDYPQRKLILTLVALTEMKEHEDVQRLIRLKKYETPGDEYFASFAESFKDRQRAEMLKSSSSRLFFERLQLWFSESQGAKWAVPAGAAAAALAAGIYIGKPASDSQTSDLAGSMPQNFLQPVSESEASEIIELRIPSAVPGEIPDGLKSQGNLVPASHSSFREL